MTASKPFRLWLLAFLLCITAILLSMAYVDRPVAEYVHAHLRHTALSHWTMRTLSSLLLVPVLALLFLLASGCWLFAGRSLASWTRTPLLCSWSVAWSVSAAIVLKHVFGRSSPYPDYVVHRIYELRPFHADSAHLAFPSGTMAVSGAILSVVWLRYPGRRVAIMLILLLLALALVITNSHWLADVIGGLFLGASVGRAYARRGQAAVNAVPRG